ncbi:hypothetical protein [Falsibacillus pallidus]|uniref:Uncharacterized protein n=1 Tax=Falsibacillus pallidus TaxID=493781 RepID=A0A370GH61_9BACI|nr:hypothetical protein [Falsibacillus pallidus]RDI43112.1 hypothetical protein DFR59_104163 [Falsibacillus pallidus]
MNFDELLSAYRNIWNNRLLETGEFSAMEILEEAIKRELLDENSHPRIRKTKEEKFYFAMKRVKESNLTTIQKYDLMALHIEVLEEIKKN